MSLKPIGLMALVAALAIAIILVLSGCTASAPAAVPTQPAAAPTKAPEPAKAPTSAPAATTAPTSQPSPVPAKKADFPAQGRAITWVVPWPSGAGTDFASRLVGAEMEKTLGTPIQVQNKPGAGSQVGLVDLVKSRPDGYTLGTTVLPTTFALYLDTNRQAGFARKDFQPVANMTLVPTAIVVKADGPYKTLKDLLDDAKARPAQVKMGDTGLGSAPQLGVLLMEKLANVKFADVHFDGGPQGITALLGGHVDAYTVSLGTAKAQIMAGNLRALGVMDKERDRLSPDIPTAEEQGLKGAYGVSMYYAISAPGSTPREAVDSLSKAIKSALETPEVKKKLEESSQTPLYMDAAQLSNVWTELETGIGPLIASLSAK